VLRVADKSPAGSSHSLASCDSLARFLALGIMISLFVMCISLDQILNGPLEVGDARECAGPSQTEHGSRLADFQTSLKTIHDRGTAGPVLGKFLDVRDKITVDCGIRRISASGKVESSQVVLRLGLPGHSARNVDAFSVQHPARWDSNLACRASNFDFTHYVFVADCWVISHLGLRKRDAARGNFSTGVEILL
jgi:hypothetical protein